MRADTTQRFDIEELRVKAQAMLNRPVEAICFVAAGANSAVYRVDTMAGSLALKVYPQRPGETMPRAQNEWNALQRFAAAGVACVPSPRAIDEASALVLMAWIDGSPASSVADGDIEAAVAFSGQVFGLSADAAPSEFPPAAEACLSGSVIVGQIERRCSMLGNVTELEPFLAQRFGPLLGRAIRHAENPRFETELPMERRRLIPADFGFHNAIRRPDGRLIFVDFDYLGWDDPVKLVADFVLHPGMHLTDAAAAAFADGIGALVRDDSDYAERLRRYLPLFGLRWALILLNVFRADRPESDGDSKLRQLAKSKVMCDRVDTLLD